MLQIEHLSKSYGTTLAVQDLSLTLQKGEIFGFIGPNGAGKSTTIKTVLGFLKKDTGTVYFDGKLLTAADVGLKKRIGYLPSEIMLYDNLTGQQMIAYNQKFYDHVDQNLVEALIKRLHFDVTKKIETYSLGNRKKLGIILCLMHNPDLIIMDEATSGLDPLMQDEFYQILREQKAQGKTIFFSSHYLQEVKKICDRVGIIKDGKLIKVDTIENIVKSCGVKVTLTLQGKLPSTLRPTQIIKETATQLQFYHHGDKASLLKIVTHQNVTQFLVEESALDDIFLNYYH